MRSASSYRAFRKKMAREAGVSLQTLNTAYDVAARAAEAAPEGMGDEAARKKLAIWAANGGRETPMSLPITPDDLQKMNDAAAALAPETEAEPFGVAINQQFHAEQAAEERAKKITIEDVDKALEKALTNHQAAGHVNPLPLNTMFAARARALGWVENVEFVEAAG